MTLSNRSGMEATAEHGPSFAAGPHSAFRCRDDCSVGCDPDSWDHSRNLTPMCSRLGSGGKTSTSNSTSAKSIDNTRLR